jgi:hypothetical protein
LGPGLGEHLAEHRGPVATGGVSHAAKPGTPGTPGLYTFDLPEQPEVVTHREMLDDLPVGHAEQVDELPPDTLAGGAIPASSGMTESRWVPWIVMCTATRSPSARIEWVSAHAPAKQA